MSVSDKPSNERPALRRRLFKRIAIGSGLAVLLLLIIVMGGAAWVMTGGADVWLASVLASKLGSPDHPATVEGFTGGVPFHPRIARLVLTDDTGGYVVVRDLAIDIDGSALWGGTLKINRLHVGDIDVERLPESASTPNTPEPASAEPPRIPTLPVALDLDSLGVDRLTLGPAVMGHAVQLALAAHGTLHAAQVDLHVIGSGINGTAADLRLDAEGQSDQAGLHLIANALGNLAAVLPGKFKPSLGDNPHLQLSMLMPGSGPLKIDTLRLDVAAARLQASGTYDQTSGAMDLALSGTGDLHPLSEVIGQTLSGNVRLAGHFGGTVARPAASVTLAGTGFSYQTYGMQAIDTKIDFSSPAEDRLQIKGRGTLTALTQNAASLPAGLGDTVTLALDATTDRAFDTIQLSSAEIHSADLVLTANARMDKGALTAHAGLKAADLDRFSSLAGMKLFGDADIALDAKRGADGAMNARIDGKLGQFKSGVAASDALLGQVVTLSAEAVRAAGGKITIAQASVDGGSFNLKADGSFDPKSGVLDGKAKMAIADLAALRSVTGPGFAGRLDLDANAGGTLQAPRIKAELTGDNLTLSGRPVERLHALIDVPSLEARQGVISVDLVAAKLAAALRAKVAQPAAGKVVISDLTLTGPSTSAKGGLTIDTARKRASGDLVADISDLGGWSSLIGPAAGSLHLSAKLTDARTQGVALDATASNLATGSGPSRQILKRLALNATLGGPNLAESNKFTGDATILGSGIQSGAAEIDTLRLTARSARAGMFDIGFATQGFISAQGARRPLKADATATLKLDPKGESAHVAALDVSYGKLTLRQTGPLDATLAGQDMHLKGLALRIGTGTLTGHADIDKRGIDVALTGGNLPLASFGHLAGQPGIAGSLSLDASVAGRRDGYGGNVTIQIPDLKLDAAEHPDLPALATKVTARLSGRQLILDGAVGNAAGRRIVLAGTVPLIVPNLPAAPQLDRNGPLSLHLTGDGRFEQWAEFIPLGEDRLTGAFAINAAVSGSVAAPKAGGGLIITDGTYENAASGMKLAGLHLDVAGTDQGFEIKTLTANDTGKGSLEGHGKVALGSGGGSVDITLLMKNFTAARSDEATAVASGNATITGPLGAPKLASEINIARAEINIPDKLPGSVVTLNVTRIDSARPVPVSANVPPPPATPPFALGLDIKLHAPGQVFVRGRGLDSEWKADLTVSGTATAPSIVGQLQATRGTYSVLGKDFTISRGVIGFYGGSQIDPSLDIVADTTASDMTAEITIGGTASKPTLALSSTPAMPQDEILSRVMFGKGVGQISPAEGLSLAQAAASLTGLGGGGPGVLDRLRKITGLDRLSLGSSASTDTNGQNSSQTSSSQGGSSLTSTSLSGGKYVAPGVFVGATQGATPGSTSAKVEVEITPHVSVDATAGSTAASQSLGVHYSLDY